MRRNALVGILLVVMFVSIIGMFGTAGASGGEGQYQKAIIIKENSGKTLTDYQIMVELNQSNFPDKAKSDGSDLRFAEDGKELSYWIEDYDAGAKTARIWVKVPKIPANEETKIKMYYGNPSASAVSDGDATFVFFDDFEGSELDRNKWSETYNYPVWTVSNSILSLRTSASTPQWNEAGIKAPEDFSHDFRAIAKVKGNYDNADLRFYCVLGEPRYLLGLKIAYWGTVVYAYTMNSEDIFLFNYPSDSPWVRCMITKVGSRSQFYWDDFETPVYQEEDGLSDSYSLTRIGTTWRQQNVYCDYVFITKYADPEPIITVYESGGGGGCGRITNWKTKCQGVYSPGQKVGAEMEFESLMGGGYNFEGVIVIRSPSGDEYTNSKEEWVPSEPNPQGKFAASDDLYVTIPEGASAGNYDMKLELWNEDTDELCDATEWKEDLFTVGPMEDIDVVLIMHFDEGFGTVANDSSGNGNGGTIYGAAWTTGVSGKALSFDGDGDYVEITPKSDVSAIGDFTISAWTYLEDWKSQITSNKDRQYVFDGHSHSKTVTSDFFRPGFGLVYDGNSSTEEIRNFIRYDDGTDLELNTQIGLKGKWIHQVFMRKGTRDYTYIDGQLISATYVSGRDAKRNDSLNMQHNWFIGTFSGNNPYHRQGVFNYSFYGIIDELRIYNRALTESEIKALYGEQEGGYGRITTWKTICQGVYSPGQKVGAEMEFENLMGDGYNFKCVIVIRSPSGDEYTNSEIEWVPSEPNKQGKFAAGDALYVTIPEGASAGNYDMKLELWNDDIDELCDATEWKEDLFFVRTDAVLIMHFDEGSGIVAKDSSGNGNNGIIHGATWTTGVSGKALSFDGNDYVSTAASSPSLNMGGSSYTIELWAKVDDSVTYTTERILVEYGTWQTGTYQLTSMNDNHSKTNFYGRSSAQGSECNNVDWTDGEWHHLVGVFDNDANYLYTYCDGEPCNATVENHAPDNVDRPLYIGSRGGTKRWFNGKLDEVAIYSRALTAEEIKALFENYVKPQSTNTIGMEFVLIPAGEFDMGSPSDEVGRYEDEGPVHHVTIKNASYMGRYEVTQKQWRAIMGDNPSYIKGDDLPVECVSWDGVQEFIKKLNEKEGTDKYRLPSEAEWEYACRAGTTTRYSFGDSESELGDYAWYYDNSDYKPHPVGQKKPNTWRLYDMHGNVLEWVQDGWHNSYDGAPADGGAWESGVGADRVIRDGSWSCNARDCRSADRCRVDTRHWCNLLGFRLLKEV